MDAYTSGGDGPVTGFVTDFSLLRLVNNVYDWYATTRLTGKVLYTNQASAEVANQYAITDRMDGMWGTAVPNHFLWGWKRAPGYFDCLGFSGTGVSGRTVNHNLGVVPEMIWIKSRSNSQTWFVYHKDLGTSHYLHLDTNDSKQADTYNWIFPAAPTSTQFSVSTYSGQNTYTYIAYLFATVAGVSKISSVVHSGTTNVDAGFSNGSRFVLLKRTDAAGDWLIWDGTRGIVSGNDPYLALNSTAAEVTNTDYIDPLSSGFTLTSNLTAGTYVYYAIA